MEPWSLHLRTDWREAVPEQRDAARGSQEPLPPSRPAKTVSFSDEPDLFSPDGSPGTEEPAGASQGPEATEGRPSSPQDPRLAEEVAEDQLAPEDREFIEGASALGPVRWTNLDAETHRDVCRSVGYTAAIGALGRPMRNFNGQEKFHFVLEHIGKCARQG